MYICAYIYIYTYTYICMIYNMLMYADLRRPSQGAQRSPRPLRPFFVCMCVCIHIYIYIYIYVYII